MRVTQAQVAVALAFRANPDGQHWGYKLVEATGFKSGVLYPKLRQMVSKGWLREEWEDPKKRDRNGPLRCYYTVTAEGKRQFAEVLATAANDKRFAHMGIEKG